MNRSYFRALERVEQMRQGKTVKPRRKRSAVDRIMAVVQICDEILDERDGVTYEDDDPDCAMVCA